MELCCLSENNLQKMKDHPIYRIRYPGKHLQELSDSYDIIDRIRGIIDDYERKQGNVFWGGSCRREIRSPLRCFVGDRK